MRTNQPYRPTPALIVSILALFVARGGTSYATLNLPPAFCTRRLAGTTSSPRPRPRTRRNRNPIGTLADLPSRPRATVAWRGLLAASRLAIASKQRSTSTSSRQS